MNLISLPSTTACTEALCCLLVETVSDGASLGFIPPLSRDRAKMYWDTVNEGISSGKKELLCSFDTDGLTGAVQLVFSLCDNALHRVEVKKLMVLPSKRKQGIGRQLMTFLEERAVAMEKKLIILSTRSGDPASALYQSMGYICAGKIPRATIDAKGNYDDTVFFYKEL